MKCKLTEFDRRYLKGMHLYDEWREAYARKYGLTYMSLTVLEYICLLQEHCTQKAICDEILYSKQCVNSIVKKFVQQGYVTLQEDPQDRRNKRIVLTPSGEAYAEMVMWPIWDIEEEAMEPLNDADSGLFLYWIETYSRAYADRVQRLLQEVE